MEFSQLQKICIWNRSKVGDVDLRNYIDKDGLDKLKKMGVIISDNDKGY